MYAARETEISARTSETYAARARRNVVFSDDRLAKYPIAVAFVERVVIDEV
jgi:hypothetical protein